MYEEYFSLTGQPFKLNPDPKFFFGSRSHNKAMAYLHYGLRQAEGFIVITGEIGAGKSMLISHLLDQLDRSRIAAAHLLTPNLRPEDLLSHILSAFRVEAAGEGKTAPLEAFEDFLFDQLNHGRRVLLIVDEAQNLPSETLEELRILSNMDYDGTPLFQVFLVGQPDFRPKLAGPNMEQLRQRIIASYHLEPLSDQETKDYIEHRLAVVGWKDDPVFTENAFASIFEETEGVPRKVNKLCNRILLYCSLEELHEINQAVVRSVSADMAEENLAIGATEEPAPDMPAPAINGAAKKDEKAAPAVKPDKAAVADAGPRIAEDERLDPQEKREANGATSPTVVPFTAVRKVNAEEAAAKAAKPDEGRKPKKGEKSEVKGETEEKMAGAKKEPVKTRADEGTSVEAADTGSLSVLDRLRLQREAKAETKDAPSPATISDVADAIAEASASNAEPVHELDRGDVDGDIDGPGFYEDLKGWRQSVAQTLNETRDELKGAHTAIVQVRRQLSDRQTKRRDNTSKVAASLARAEKLLSELRD